MELKKKTDSLVKLSSTKQTMNIFRSILYQIAMVVPPISLVKG
jgi:hypothetical protein